MASNSREVYNEKLIHSISQMPDSKVGFFESYRQITSQGRLVTAAHRSLIEDLPTHELDLDTYRQQEQKLNAAWQQCTANIEGDLVELGHPIKPVKVLLSDLLSALHIRRTSR